MSDEDTYYVYLYSDYTGEPIYVGKGKGSRANSHNWASAGLNSNKRLQRLLNSRRQMGITLEPEIIATGSEKNMFMVEIALIKMFGRADEALGTLFNATDGGEGVSNPSDEVRKKQSETAFRTYGEERRFIFIHAKTGEEFEGNCPEFSKHIGHKNTTNVNRLVLEGSDLNSIGGWTIKGSGIVANEYMTEFDFIHAGTKDEFTGTQAELVKYTQMSPASVSNVVSGRSLHSLGWCLKKNLQMIPHIRKSPDGLWQIPERSWFNNSTKKSMIAWAMADEILDTYTATKKIKKNIAAAGLARSMGILEYTTITSVQSVLNYFTAWAIKPMDLRIWTEFQEEYKKTNRLPENKFNGSIVDGRTEYRDIVMENKKEKVKKLCLQSRYSKTEIANLVGVSTSTVSRVRRAIKEKQS